MCHCREHAYPNYGAKMSQVLYSWGPTIVYDADLNDDVWWLAEASCLPADPSHQHIWLFLKGAVVLIFNDSQCNVYSIASCFGHALYYLFTSIIVKEDLELLILPPSPPKFWDPKLCDVLTLFVQF